MTTNRFTAACALLPLLAGSLTAADPKPEPTIVRFGKGGWDAAKWKPARLANQAKPKPFTQLDGALGTTKDTFTADEYGREVDNALLLHDLGTAEAEVEVAF